MDSIFQLILWNIAYNQQNLGRQTSNKLIQLVCHYYLAIVECESDSTSVVADGNLFFTIFDNRKHPLEDCQVKIIDHIHELLTSKSTDEKKIFSYRNYWDIFLIFHSIRYANGNKPLKLLSALLKTLEPNRRSEDGWYSSWDSVDRALTPLEWSDYDRFWRPNLEEDVWQYNANVLGHTDSVGIESIIDHCFAFDKNVGMRLIGCLICQVHNKIRHGPFADLSKNELLNIFESISHKTSNMATQGIRGGIQSRHFKQLFITIGRFYPESIYVRDSTEDRIKQYRNMRDYCVKLVDIHCENLLEVEAVTSENVRVLKQEISSHFSSIPLPLYLSANYTPTKVNVEGDWIEAPYRKWESLYSEDWTERAETIFLARMEQLRLNALKPKNKMTNLVDSLLDYKFGESYSRYISDILYQKYVSEHENISTQIAWSLGNMIRKTTATENERSCFTCGEINPMPIHDCVCDRCIFDSAGSTVWAERELSGNSGKTIYLLEILFFLYRKDFNYYSKDVRGKYIIFDSLIENLRKLSKKKPKKFIVDDIIEEFNEQAKWGEEWLTDYYYSVSSTPYKLIVEKTINLILDNWDAEANERSKKNQKTKLQDALDLYFLIPDENEDLVTERIIRLLSVGFERLLAFNWGYAFNGSTNKYYLISRIDEIISIVNQNKLFTIEQLEKQFTIPEELEFASGYVSQQRESRYYDLLSTTLNEIRKFISSNSNNPTKTAREIIQHFGHVETTGVGLEELITYFDNFVGEAAELSQCFFDFETIESDEKRYSSIKPKSGYRVVCDLSGLGVGRPMQIPHESYVKWARRRELIRDEIESISRPVGW